MNRRTPGLPLAQAIPGFLLYKTAEALSPNTLRSYQDHLKLWLKYTGDIAVERVTPADLCAFLAWLHTDYTPRRLNGHTAPLAAKTLRNYWISLSAFFTWATNEFGIPNPMQAVPAPKFENAPVEPFTREEIDQLLKAAEFCNAAQTTRRRRFAVSHRRAAGSRGTNGVMRRPTARRDRALVLVPLDTGLRASELCALNVGDVDLKTGQVLVKPGQAGGAKGGKGRVVYLGKAARRALWHRCAWRAAQMRRTRTRRCSWASCIDG